jgi:hypothetical protein
LKTYGIIIERRETRSTTVEVKAPNVTQAKRAARELSRTTAQFTNVPIMSLRFVAVDSWECDR